MSVTASQVAHMQDIAQRSVHARVYAWQGCWRAGNASLTCSPQSFFTLCRFLGHAEEPFQPVRQHGGQREKQDGGDEQELCKSIVSFSHRLWPPAPPPTLLCLCVSGERVPGFQHSLLQLFVHHDVFKGRRRASQSVSGELVHALCSRRGTYVTHMPAAAWPCFTSVFVCYMGLRTCPNQTLSSTLAFVIVNRLRRHGERLKTLRVAWRRWPLDITSIIGGTW